MEPKYRFRLYLLTALVLVGCGTLLSRLYEFQILQRSNFVANIPTTHTVTVREPGVRGIIIDRHGVVLAENRGSYEVIFNLEDIYKSWQEQNEDTPTVKEIVSGPQGMPTQKESKDIARIVNEWVIPRLSAYGLGGKKFTKAVKVHYETHGGLVPFTYETDLNYSQFAQLAAHSTDLPGVSVTVRPRRTYPYGTLACHLLGKVRQWDKEDIPAEFSGRRMHYQGDERGIEGIELTMNEALQGEGGVRVLVRNEKNKVIALEDYTPPREGAEVQLTIDSRIQYLVENILRRVGRGAVVVMDPNTGEVLAMASVPNFDPNDFVPSITQEKFDRYNKNPAAPFLNRSIAGFMSGSTAKLPTAIAGGLHGSTEHYHKCIGFCQYGKSERSRIRCWKTYGHGSLGMSEAIQRSCNPYFMTLAGSLKSKVMVDTFNLLNLGRPTGIRLPEEQAGIVLGSKQWRREIRPGATLTPADLAQMSIGQSDSLATPLQICGITATIANGGKYYQPRIIRQVVDSDSSGEQNIILENKAQVKVDLLEKGMKKEQLEIIRQGMWLAANKLGGTARTVALKNVEIGAKTGTAQVSKTNLKNSHNAWTTSFAPFESPRYAVTVMVSNGKSGGLVAGALTHLIYRGLFAMEAGLDPRLTKMGVYAGHFEPIEKIELPEGELVTLDIADAGETGNEVGDELFQEGQPVLVKPKTIPLPSFTPQPDEPDGGQ